MTYALLLTASLCLAQADGAKLKIGQAAAWEYVPAGKGPFAALVLVHGDFGPTKWVHQQATRLAGKGYHVLVIDLYGGELPKTVEEAHILERGLEDDKVNQLLKASVDYLAKRPGVRGDRIGILGWDMGGGHALEAAIHDKRLRGVVNCYGRVPTDPKTLATLQAPVLALFAGKDEGLPKSTIDQFRKAMTKAGKQASIHLYDDCENGFMDPDCPYLSARPAAATIADAWGRIEKFLAQQLRGND